MSDARHRVVVIGGGFGGLFATQALRRAPADVVLVDRTGYHLFQPLLYQVATGILSQGEVARPLREILRRQRNASLLLGQVDRIDLTARTVTSTALGRTTVTSYDSLVVAAGATHSYFGNERFAEHAPGLKSLDDALEIRARIFEAFELAESSRRPRRAVPPPHLRRGRRRADRDRGRRPDRGARRPQPATQLPQRRPGRRARGDPGGRPGDAADVRGRPVGADPARPRAARRRGPHRRAGRRRRRAQGPLRPRRRRARDREHHEGVGRRRRRVTARRSARRGRRRYAVAVRASSSYVRTARCPAIRRCSWSAT